MQKNGFSVFVFVFRKSTEIVGWKMSGRRRNLIKRLILQAGMMRISNREVAMTRRGRRNRLGRQFGKD